MNDTIKSVNELIENITKNNMYKPLEDANSTGLSPDLSDEDIDGFIKRQVVKSVYSEEE